MPRNSVFSHHPEVPKFRTGPSQESDGPEPVRRKHQRHQKKHKQLLVSRRERVRVHVHQAPKTRAQSRRQNPPRMRASNLRRHVHSRISCSRSFMARSHRTSRAPRGTRTDRRCTPAGTRPRTRWPARTRPPTRHGRAGSRSHQPYAGCEAAAGHAFAALQRRRDQAFVRLGLRSRGKP
jgi:hypothetical protein